VPQDVKAHLELTRYISKPEKPSGRLSRIQKDQLFRDEARMNPLRTFHDLYRCHDKGREGSPTYDDAGFELDYEKVADWMKPQAYNKNKMIRGMERAVEKAKNEEKQIFELFFENSTRDPITISPEAKDYVLDHVSKDLGIPWHHVKSEQVRMWRDAGFQPVKYEDWWKEPTGEDIKRMSKMRMGASLRK
jgi:hypothetical protein